MKANDIEYKAILIDNTLYNLQPCSRGLQWIQRAAEQGMSISKMWQTCQRGDWMTWFLQRPYLKLSRHTNAQMDALIKDVYNTLTVGYADSVKTLHKDFCSLGVDYKNITARRNLRFRSFMRAIDTMALSMEVTDILHKHLDIHAVQDKQHSTYTLRIRFCPQPTN